MIALAAVFAVMRALQIQQVGFALAIAVIFDTTVILLVLLPALMGLAGKYLWYLPSWLNWIPGGPKQPLDQVSAQPAVASADDGGD